MANNYEQIYVKVGLDSKNFDTSLAGMKKEMASLKGVIGSSLLTPEENNSLKARFGELNNEFKDLRTEAVNAGTQLDETFGNVARAGSVVTSSFGGIIAGLSLFGIESKKAGELEKQLIQTIAIAQSLQAVSEAKNLKALALSYAQKFKNLLLFKSEKVLAAENIAMTGAQTVATGAQTAATGLLTRAQLAFNAAVRANPLGVFLLAITAVIAGITLLVSMFRSMSNAQEKANESWKDTISNLTELNKNIVEAKEVNKELRDEYLLQSGVLNEIDLKRIKLLDEYIKKVKQVKDEELIRIKELSGKLSEGLISEQSYQDQRSSLTKKTTSYLVELEINYNQTVENLRLERTKDLQNKEIQLQDSIQQYRKQKFTQLLSDMKENYSAIQSALSKIDQLIKSKKDEQQKLQIENLPEGEEKELQKLNIEYQKRKQSVEEYNAEWNKNVNIIDKSLEKLYLQEEQLKRSKGVVKQISALYSTQKSQLNNQLQEAKDLYNEKNIGYNNEIEKQKVLNNEIEKLQEDPSNAFKIQNKQDELNASIQLSNSFQTQANSFLNQTLLLKTQIGEVDLKLLQNTEKNLQLEEELKALSEQKKITYKDLENTFNSINKNINFKSGFQMAFQLVKDLYGEILKIDKDYEEKKLKLKEEYKLKAKQLEAQNIIDITTELNEELGLRKSLYDNILNSEDTTLKQKKLAGEEIKKIILEQIRLNNIIIEQEIKLLRLENERIKASNLKPEEKEQKNKVNEAKIKTLETKKETTTQEGQGEITGVDETIQKSQEEKYNEVLQYAQMGVQVFSDFVSTITSIQLETAQRQMEENLSKIQEMQQFAQDQNELQYRKGLKTHGQYVREKERIDKEAKRKEAEEKNKFAKKEREMKIWNAVTSGAQSVLSALSTQPFILGVILAVLAAGLAAYQISAISNEPLPSFATGGLVGGQYHSMGGTKILAEKDEFIVNRNVVQQPGVKEFLYNLNAGSNQITQQQPVYVNNNSMSKEEIRNIVSEVVAIPVINVESESTGVQRKVSNIESSSVVFKK